MKMFDQHSAESVVRLETERLQIVTSASFKFEMNPKSVENVVREVLDQLMHKMMHFAESVVVCAPDAPKLVPSMPTTTMMMKEADEEIQTIVSPLSSKAPAAAALPKSDPAVPEGDSATEPMQPETEQQQQSTRIDTGTTEPKQEEFTTAEEIRQASSTLEPPSPSEETLKPTKGDFDDCPLKLPPVESELETEPKSIEVTRPNIDPCEISSGPKGQLSSPSKESPNPLRFVDGESPKPAEKGFDDPDPPLKITCIESKLQIFLKPVVPSAEVEAKSIESLGPNKYGVSSTPEDDSIAETDQFLSSEKKSENDQLLSHDETVPKLTKKEPFDDSPPKITSIESELQLFLQLPALTDLSSSRSSRSSGGNISRKKRKAETTTTTTAADWSATDLQAKRPAVEADTALTLTAAGEPEFEKLVPALSSPNEPEKAPAKQSTIEDDRNFESNLSMEPARLEVNDGALAISPGASPVDANQQLAVASPTGSDTSGIMDEMMVTARSGETILQLINSPSALSGDEKFFDATSTIHDTPKTSMMEESDFEKTPKPPKLSTVTEAQSSPSTAQETFASVLNNFSQKQESSSSSPAFDKTTVSETEERALNSETPLAAAETVLFTLKDTPIPPATVAVDDKPDPPKSPIPPVRSSLPKQQQNGGPLSSSSLPSTISEMIISEQRELIDMLKREKQELQNKVDLLTKELLSAKSTPTQPQPSQPQQQIRKKDDSRSVTPPATMDLSPSPAAESTSRIEENAAPKCPIESRYQIRPCSQLDTDAFDCMMKMMSLLDFNVQQSFPITAAVSNSSSEKDSEAAADGKDEKNGKREPTEMAENHVNGKSELSNDETTESPSSPSSTAAAVQQSSSICPPQAPPTPAHEPPTDSSSASLSSVNKMETTDESSAAAPAVPTIKQPSSKRPSSSTNSCAASLIPKPISGTGKKSNVVDLTMDQQQTEEKKIFTTSDGRRLQITEYPGRTTRMIALTGTTTIGRCEIQSDIKVSGDVISKVHGKFRFVERGMGRKFFVYENVGRNGSLINGDVVIAPTRLQDGDRLEIGTPDGYFHVCYHSAAIACVHCRPPPPPPMASQLPHQATASSSSQRKPSATAKKLSPSASAEKKQSRKQSTSPPSSMSNNNHSVSSGTGGERESKARRAKPTNGGQDYYSENSMIQKALDRARLRSSSRSPTDSSEMDYAAETTGAALKRKKSPTNRPQKSTSADGAMSTSTTSTTKKAASPSEQLREELAALDQNHPVPLKRKKLDHHGTVNNKKSVAAHSGSSKKSSEQNSNIKSSSSSSSNGHLKKNGIGRPKKNI